MTLDTFLALPERFVVFLARHATPDRSRYDIPYHLPPGPPLTARGRSEAAALGEFLRGEGLAYLLSSPLERTWTTAQIAGQAADAPVVLNHDLLEWQPGEAETALRERMGRAFNLAARLSCERGPVGLVSHGAPVLALLSLLGLPQEEAERRRIYDSRNLLPPAGAWLVQKDGRELSLCLAYLPEGAPVPAGYAPQERAADCLPILG